MGWLLQFGLWRRPTSPRPSKRPPSPLLPARGSMGVAVTSPKASSLVSRIKKAPEFTEVLNGRRVPSLYVQNSQTGGLRSLKLSLIVLRNAEAWSKTQVRGFVAGLSLLLALLKPGLVLADQAQSTEVVRKVAEAQKRLSWFWSPPIEGLADIPYTYETKQTETSLGPPRQRGTASKSRGRVLSAVAKRAYGAHCPG